MSQQQFASSSPSLLSENNFTPGQTFFAERQQQSPRNRTPNSTSKRRRLSSMSDARIPKKKIGTHSGTFHCDEVLACFMLKQLDQYRDAEILRTRDAKVLNLCDAVVDVGGVYNPGQVRYDHHQRTFQETMKTLSNGRFRWETRLSSAGLVYFHHGRDVLAKVLKLDSNTESTERSNSSLLDVVYERVYEGFVEEIDAIDNGISVVGGGIEPKYSITTNLSSRVGYLNPNWCNPDGGKDEVQFVQFEKAMKMVGSELVDRVLYYAEVWWPARMVVEEALANRFEADPSGEILVLGIESCPWKEHLRMLEEEEEEEGDKKKSNKLKGGQNDSTSASIVVLCQEETTVLKNGGVPMNGCGRRETTVVKETSPPNGSERGDDFSVEAKGDGDASTEKNRDATTTAEKKNRDGTAEEKNRDGMEKNRDGMDKNRDGTTEKNRDGMEKNRDGMDKNRDGTMDKNRDCTTEKNRDGMEKNRDGIEKNRDASAEKNRDGSKVKFVLYEDSNTNWRIQCVPALKNSFENRLSLPEEWRGLREEELSSACGVKGSIFVHATGFIGGNKTKEGVLQMARKALKLSRQQ